MYIDIDSSRNFEAGFRYILDVQFLQMIFNEGDILTLKSIFHMILKDGIIAIWERERASVSLLMLSAKQGNNWYHFF